MTSLAKKSTDQGVGNPKPKAYRPPREAPPVVKTLEEAFLEQFQTELHGEISQAYGLGPWLKQNKLQLQTLTAICRELKERFGNALTFFLTPDSENSKAPVMLTACLDHFDMALANAIEEIYEKHPQAMARFEPMLVIVANFNSSQHTT